MLRKKRQWNSKYVHATAYHAEFIMPGDNVKARYQNKTPQSWLERTLFAQSAWNCNMIYMQLSGVNIANAGNG